ncbi:MAG TPA: amidohydrolase [Thermoanaerobaculia bacterium]|nr:amidohydrolase [Thermoanaerobaculia bacterium]
MTTIFAAPALAALLALPAASGSPALAPIDALYPELEAFYIDLHRTPELSTHEEKTSAKLAERLRRLGYEVTDHVGGYGVVGVMKNGKGPTVLVRADMDALPVEEQTGLPYASKVKVVDDSGHTVPVMHACGHDVHMTSLVGAAALLARARARWRGTLVLVGQPSEEGGPGSVGMLQDGFLERFPKPDFALALHDDPRLPAGMIGYTPGYALANSDVVDITVYGRGGHGSAPQYTVDPIVVAARMILAFQTIVSRENDPLDPAVVTVGMIHGGTKRNIIPDEVTLALTVRSYKDEVRRKLLAAIERIAKAEAAAAGAPREPSVKIELGFGATYNDPALTKRIVGALDRAFGTANVVEQAPVMGSEDFGEFGRAAHAPSLMFRLGAVAPARFEAVHGDVTQLPSLHSSRFAPDPEPTLKTGAGALTVAVLEILGRK